MKNPKFTDAEIAIVYKIVSKINSNTYLDTISGKNLPNEWHSFNFTREEIIIIKKIFLSLTSLLKYAS